MKPRSDFIALLGFFVLLTLPLVMHILKAPSRDSSIEKRQLAELPPIPTNTREVRLFPEKIDVSGGKPLSKPFPAADILHCLNGEVIFLIVCAEALAKGKKLEKLDKERLYLSATRFRAAMVAGGLNRAA